MSLFRMYEDAEVTVLYGDWLVSVKTAPQWY